MIALRGDEDAGPLRKFADKGGGHRNLGLLDIVGPAFGRPMEIDHDRERSGGSNFLRGIDLIDDISMRSAHPAVGKVLLVLSEEWVGLEREKPAQGKQDQEEGMRGHHSRVWSGRMTGSSGPHQTEKPAIPVRENSDHAGDRGFPGGSRTEGPGEPVRSQRFLEEELACLWQKWPGDDDAAIGENTEGWVGKERERICASALAYEGPVDGEIVISSPAVHEVQ